MKFLEIFFALRRKLLRQNGEHNYAIVKFDIRKACISKETLGTTIYTSFKNKNDLNEYHPSQLLSLHMYLVDNFLEIYCNNQKIILIAKINCTSKKSPSVLSIQLRKVFYQNSGKLADHGFL